MSACSNYIQQYSEPEVERCHHFPEHISFEHVLVIPCYQESAGFLERFYQSTLVLTRTLLILVINQPDDVESCPENEALYRHLLSTGPALWQSGNLTLTMKNDTVGLLIVDRFQVQRNSDRRIPRKQGVGLARKIGADIAVSFIDRGIIRSNWIHSTDADAILPDDYFLATPPPSAKSTLLFSSPYQKSCFSAVVYPFKHIGGGRNIHEATLLYEKSLRYYVSGLKWAGSPYAFFTIGSLLAINAEAYCLVRGFPKRAGGEDFYLLNKLAKIAPLWQSESKPVLIHARTSSRVPFGTGPAVQKIIALKEKMEPLKVYNPAIFIDLQTWLGFLPNIFHHKDSINNLFNTLPPQIVAALHDLGIEKIIQHINKQAKTQKQCEHHLHTWFDAFKTLKFIHFLEKNYYPPVDIYSAGHHFPP